MPFNALIRQFAEQAPIATIVRGLMANILFPTELNAIFRETAERQHESPLLFSTVVDLLSLVVSKVGDEVNAAEFAALCRAGHRSNGDSILVANRHGQFIACEHFRRDQRHIP
jgi:hypothetical protein